MQSGCGHAEAEWNGDRGELFCPLVKCGYVYPFCPIEYGNVYFAYLAPRDFLHKLLTKTPVVDKIGINVSN